MGQEKEKLEELSRRERQIMNILYRLESATAVEVRDNLPDPPSMNAVRRLLSILEEKGFVRHKWDGPRYLFSPLIEKRKAEKAALKQLVETFFDGSRAKAMAALFESSEIEFSRDEKDAFQLLIEKASEKEKE